MIICTLPLIAYVHLCCFYLLASASLGEWARPGVHDPKGFLFGIPLFIQLILLNSSIAVAPVVVIVGFLRGSISRHVIAYITCMAIGIVLFLLDLQQVTTWIAD